MIKDDWRDDLSLLASAESHKHEANYHHRDPRKPPIPLQKLAESSASLNNGDLIVMTTMKTRKTPTGKKKTHSRPIAH